MRNIDHPTKSARWMETLAWGVDKQHYFIVPMTLQVEHDMKEVVEGPPFGAEAPEKDVRGYSLVVFHYVKGES